MTKSIKRFLLYLFVIYGCGVSAVTFTAGIADMDMLNKAFKQEARHAEMRHRINVFADGTWFLLGNLIVLVGISSLGSTEEKS